MKFKEGDGVFFEMSGEENDDSVPRLNLGNVSLASGIYGEGVVTNIGDSDFTIEYTYNKVYNIWDFKYADKEQPGFPYLSEASVKQSEEQAKATVSLNKWFGQFND